MKAKTKPEQEKSNIAKMADRAYQMVDILGHGGACYAAVREFGIPEEDVPATASLVSAELTNRSL